MSVKMRKANRITTVEQTDVNHFKKAGWVLYEPKVVEKQVTSRKSTPTTPDGSKITTGVVEE